MPSRPWSSTESGGSKRIFWPLRCYVTDFCIDGGNCLSALVSGGEPNWNANYSTFLTHITWANAMNGTLLSQATYNTNYSSLMLQSTYNTNYSSLMLQSTWNSNYTANNDAWLNTTNYSYLTTANLAGTVNGSGTYGYVPMWNSTNSINNSVIYQNGTNIGINTTNPQSTLNVVGTFNATTSSGGGVSVDSNGNVKIGI